MNAEWTGAAASGLPKVSVVVTNRNYGRFLPGAIASVEAQSYPHWELIVVDDASTDDSVAVVEGLIAAGRPVSLIRLDENVGQGTAARRGFEASSGQFVVFLDADDRLYPDCLKVHLFALMSCRRGVAFSSCDAVQVADGQTVRYGFPGIWRGLREAGPEGRAEIADFSDRLPPDLLGAAPLDRLVYRPPGLAGWPWSPMSSNCFRRDALAILFRRPEVEVRRAFDGIAMRVASALFGSVLIDVPLSQYTIHGANMTSSFADLDGSYYWNPDHDAVARRRAIDLLVEGGASLVGNGGVIEVHLIAATAGMMRDGFDLYTRAELERKMQDFATALAAVRPGEPAERIRSRLATQVFGEAGPRRKGGKRRGRAKPRGPIARLRKALRRLWPKPDGSGR